MAKKRRLRIATYNINGINGRLGILTQWLEEFQPDVVLTDLKMPGLDGIGLMEKAQATHSAHSAHWAGMRRGRGCWRSAGMGAGYRR